jgi:LDH2 family malate/lactate/ureidoglycolate dehydrogenase
MEGEGGGMAEAIAKEGVYPADALQRFTARVFEAAGMPGSDADIMAEHLVWADLHGVAWLGVRKIPQYLARMRAGGTPAQSEARTVVDMPALVVVDARNAWGQVVGNRLMETILPRARASGVCVGLVRNTTTAGVLGRYANMAASQGMIGMAINNSPPLQAAAGGVEKVTGNQAFAIAAPAGKHPPLVLDMATSAITLARLHEYAERGESISDGVALDAEGAPTRDAAKALKGVLLPMAGHRGFGLALMWEVLTGVLSGSEQFSTDALMPDAYDRPQGISLFMMAIDPEAVMPRQVFEARVERVIDAVRASKPAPGVGRITVPGERSHAIAASRRREGIAIPGSLRATLVAIAAEHGVPWPG